MTQLFDDTAGLATSLQHVGVVPVIQIDDAEAAGGLAEALVAGGLPVAEITFRTAAAPAAIGQIRHHSPDVLVGAGTVRTPEAVDVAVEAGAAFVVTPGFNPRVVRRCLDVGIPVVPGVSSPGEVERALEHGLSLLKFFPAVPAGGIPMVRALSGPYPEVRLMPTGGITRDAIGEWLAQPNVVAVGGTWIATADDIAHRRFDLVTSNARAAVEATASASHTSAPIPRTDKR